MNDDLGSGHTDVLRNTLQSIAQGQQRFATGTGESDEAGFQRVAESILYAERHGYISKAIPHKSYRNGIAQYDLVIVQGGLTPEGEIFLANLTKAVIPNDSHLRLEATERRGNDLDKRQRLSRKEPTQLEDETTWDVFISHASEDKDAFVRPLARELRRSGLRVWLDELILTLGDSLHRRIDEGLSKSRFGVVVLSHAFFAKEWPRKELDGLAARESSGMKVILPIWHGLSREEVASYSPMLAGRLAASSTTGIAVVVQKILAAIDARKEDIARLGQAPKPGAVR